MKKLTTTVMGLFLSTVGLATEYEWVGGTDLNWSTAANWNPNTGYPNGTSDIAKFTASPAGPVVVSSDVTVLQVAASPSTVVAIGGTGSLTTPSGNSSFSASEGAVLSVECRLKGSSRVDIGGTGTVVFDSAITNTMDSANSCAYLFALTNVFGANANLSTKSPLCFGLGKQSYVSRSFIRDGAVLVLHDLQLAAGSSSCSETRVVQEGGTVTAAGFFDLNSTGTAAKQYYTIKDGTLTVANLKVATASGGGEFVQDGGTVTAKTTFSLLNGDYFLNGGTLNIQGSGTGSAGTLTVADGTTLALGTASKSSTLADVKTVFSGGAATIDVSGTVTVTGAGSWTFADGSALNLVSSAGGGTLILQSDTVLPDTVVIGDGVTLKVGTKTYLTGRSSALIALTVKSGGKLALTDQSSYLAHPLDLTVEDGGTIDFSSNARTALVAYSYVLDGTTKNPGRYTVKDDSVHLTGVNQSAILVPHAIWTGAGGDGKWSTVANWKDKYHPTYLTGNPIVDLSQATGTVTLSSSVTLKGITYLPSASGATCRLSAGETASSCSFVAESWGILCLVGRDRTLELECDLSLPSAVGILAGKGTVKLLRGLNRTDYLDMDGTLAFGGTASFSTNLSAYRDQENAEACIRFVEGADVTVGGKIRFLKGDMVMMNAFLQDAGSVSAPSLYLTPYREVPTGGGYYRLTDGALTLADGLFLGDDCEPANAGERRPGGVFYMDGGTLVTPLFSTELNSNYCYLRGGEVRLGSGGFVKSAADGAHKSYVANTDPCFRFGGVTVLATANWSSDAALDFLLEGDSGNPVFDTAGFAATVNGTVSGIGGLVKEGEGTLTLAGTYSATGDIRVNGGSLVLSSVAPNLVIGTLDVRAADALSLPEGANVTVAKLFVGGKWIRSGTHAFGAGTVTVPRTTTYAWIGKGDASSWSDAANWADGNVPNGADVELDFGDSDLPATIAVDTAVQLKAIHLDWTNVTLTASSGGVLTLGGGAALDIDAGATLELAGETRLTAASEANFSTTLEKRGLGRLVVSGLLRSAVEPAELTFGKGGILRTTAGETVIDGEVAGVHVYPISRDAEIVPTVTLEANAVMTNAAFLTGVFDAFGGSPSYGAVVMNGGLVEIGGVALRVFGSNGSGRDGAGGYRDNGYKYCFAWFDSGVSSFTITGGRMTVAATNLSGQWISSSMNLNDMTANGGVSSLVLNGGSLTMKSTNPISFGIQDDEQDSLWLKDGVLDTMGSFRCFGRPTSKHPSVLRLDGGTLKMNGTVSVDCADTAHSPFKVTIGENIAFAQATAATVMTFDTPVNGAIGKVTNLGPGKVVFKDLSGLPETNGFDLSVQGGEVELDGKEMNLGRIDFGGSGVLNLAFEGTEEAESLYVNGRQRGQGDYGSTARLSQRFAGSGLLKVLTGENRGVMLIVR